MASACALVQACFQQVHGLLSVGSVFDEIAVQGQLALNSFAGSGQGTIKVVNANEDQPFQHYTLRHEVISWVSRTLFGNLTYTVRHGPLKGMRDRKSTRLNSSHLGISYA